MLMICNLLCKIVFKIKTRIQIITERINELEKVNENIWCYMNYNMF